MADLFNTGPYGINKNLSGSLGGYNFYTDIGIGRGGPYYSSGLNTNLLGIVDLNLTDRNRARAIEASIELPFTRASYTRQKGLSDIVRAYFGEAPTENEITPKVASKLGGYIEWEKSKRGQFNALFGYNSKDLDLNLYANGLGTKNITAGIEGNYRF